MSPVIVVCCHAEVSAVVRSFVQRIPTDCGVCDCDPEPQRGGICPLGLSSHEKTIEGCDTNGVL